MEGADAGNHSKPSFRRNSNSHISMSDTESMTSQGDSFHSPLRSESPLRSDDPSFRPQNDKNDKAIVLVDKYYSPVPSPGKSGAPEPSPAAVGKGWRRWPHSASENLDIPVSSPQGSGREGENLEIPAVVGLNKFVREEAPPGVKKVGPVGGDGALEEGYGGGRGVVGGERRSRAAVESILKRSGRNTAVRRVALAFRVFEVISCLISFSVMAADKTEGWSGDSFGRYIEYSQPDGCCKQILRSCKCYRICVCWFPSFGPGLLSGEGEACLCTPSSLPFRICNGSDPCVPSDVSIILGSHQGGRLDF
ncbi:CASP-like protein 4A2 isoform X2 [Salvia hispanica]|uniref:CASP-like protein 4A2 isoform X2 n=1 Tax=Salvia hispanica TaxID=49212 RepID=UPI00200909EC|nr:CASP-like protein 4A2 isoform X2 [Salvia hispanica]